MGERVYVVVDGVDGRVHHLEFADPARIEDVRRGMIIEAAPLAARPRAADLNIADLTDEAGIYRPSAHLERARQGIERIGGDPEAFVRSHVRRLDALRRAGHVERLDTDQWRVPADISERGMRYDLSHGGGGLAIRTLSTLDLNAQVGSDGATWLDRELASRSRTPLAGTGFGRDVADAMERRQQALVDMGHATQSPEGRIRAHNDLVSRLECTEVTRVGTAIAVERGLTFQQAKTGEYVSGKLVGSTQLASGRYAMIESFSGDGGLGFSLVPW